MTSERKSAVIVGLLVGCLAGVATFAYNNEATSFYSAPVATSSRVSVVPTAALQAVSNGYSAAEQTPENDDLDLPWETDYSESRVQAPSWSGVVASLLAAPIAVAGLLQLKKRSNPEKSQLLVSVDDLLSVGKKALVATAVVASASAPAADAYPIFAQQGYENPREATGRIVCANCHLAAKKTEIEMPQAVLPDQVFQAVTKVPYAGTPSTPNVLDASSVVGSVTFADGQPVEFSQESGIPVSQVLMEMAVPGTPDTVFKATIKVPYDDSLRQPGANGKAVPLNVGAVVVLPEGFTLAPPERIPEKLKEEMKGLQFVKYSEKAPNIIVAGPVPGSQYEEMTVALLSPDPATNKNVHFGTLPVFVGGNRGRGQYYPSGEKSNNVPYEAVHAGKIEAVELKNEKKRLYEIDIREASGVLEREVLPPGATPIVTVGDIVQVGQPLTTNPNVGGFGQAETEIVLQDPGRVKAFLFFSFTVLATQTMLVVKKKQYEQVQLSEMNF